MRPALILLTLCLLASNLRGVILYSGDNSANRSAPDAARASAFASVGRVTDATGTAVNGSAVHLKGKYVLTANHVSTGSGSYISFDNENFWERDTAFAPVRFGDADIKLIKLVKDPNLPEIELFSASSGDLPLQITGGGPPRLEYTMGTLIGWGRGRDPDDPDGLPTWDWGNNATIAKRWGTNRIETQSIGSNPIEYNLGGIDYSYEAIETNLDSTFGADEAGASLFDSGSGLFIESDGVWQLAGLTAAVSTSGSSTFSSVSPDRNYFVRINQIASDIEAAIPDLTTYSGWQIDHSLYGNDAENDADTDFDGIGQLLEFAFGGDPNKNDLSILPTKAFVEDGGSTYLELIVTRPVGLQGITYTPKTTTDLNNWPDDSAGITSGTPTDNGNGTETIVYRRTQAVAGADQAFIQVDVTETP